MNNRYLSFFGGLLLLMGSACNSKTGTAPTDEGGPHSPSPENRHEHRVDSRQAPSLVQRLQGRWESVQDGKSYIEFKDKTYIEYYGKEKMTEQALFFAAACKGEPGSETTGDDQAYFTTADGFCYFVSKLTDTELELTYTARGNTLSYLKKN